MSARARIAWIVLWWLLLAVAGVALQRVLVVSSDLRSFMPPPKNADQRLLLDEIGEGPASQLLLIAIAGGDQAQRARSSRDLVQRLRGDTHFAAALNGDEDASSLDAALLPYRYLLSPTLDIYKLDDPRFLHDELEQRVADLAAPGSAEFEDLLRRDPTLEVLKLAQRWTPVHTPALREGVWFSPSGEALLLAQTRATGFDTSAQAAAIAALRADFDALPGTRNTVLTISGPGYIGTQVAADTRASAERLSAIGTLGFAALLLFAYRSFGVLALAALPLLSGALAGLSALATIFGAVHGITLAFGFTLLGVAQEYPLRLLSHRRTDIDAQTTTREIWPLLRLAIASACIAYFAFFASGVAGLAQLASFTIVGLLVAGAATRWLLPPLLPEGFRDVATIAALERARAVLESMPRPRWLPWLVLVLALAMLAAAPSPLWQNDLAALTPVPAALLQREGELRDALGAPDVRYLLVLEAQDDEAVLGLAERISPQVDKWIADRLVDDVELPTRYLPSLTTQRARQMRLPQRATLAAALQTALADLPLDAATFEPFLDDVDKARTLAPLTPAEFWRSPFGTRLRAMLVRRDERSFGLATLSGVRDANALQTAVAALGASVRLLDLKSASEDLVVQYRARILQALGAALLLLALTVALAFRDWRRAWHVIAPMSLATLLVLAVLRAGGVSLSLFHLVALTLAAGLGLHYALFFERRVADAAEARRTLHATLVCVLSAVLVFGLLATSAVPVLRAIGLTVALGVAFHFCLSIQMARPRDGEPR